MKYFLIALIAIVFLYSCEKKESVVAEKETVVSGILRAFPSFDITITEDDPYDLNFEYIILASGKVDSSGKFSLKFAIEKPKVVQLRLGNQVLINTLYVYPDDELNLRIDNRSIENFTIIFEGNATKVNEFNRNLASFFPKDREMEDQLYNPDLNSFIEWNNKRRKEMLDYYKDFFIKDTVPLEVNVHEISDINYQWAYLQNEWALRNFYFNREAWSKKVLPDNFWDFLKNINFAEPYLHNFIERYLESLVWDWHIKQVNEGKPLPTTQDRELIRYEQAKNKFTAESRDIALSVVVNNLLAVQFDERAVPIIKNLIDKAKKDIVNRKYIKPLEEKFKKRLALLKGNKAPDFSLPNIFKAPIALSDFKGKVVYLYFWSTLNPASPYYIKFVNDLQMKFARDTNIVFLSLGLENNTWDRWKSFVDTNKVIGPQIYVEGDFSNKVAKDFMVNSLPACIIIDKQGKIFSTTAPFPNDKKLPDLLKSLF